jgi:signal recognition particle subunit SRP54
MIEQPNPVKRRAWTVEDIVAQAEQILEEGSAWFIRLLDTLWSLPGGQKLCEELDFEKLRTSAMHIRAVYNSMTLLERKSPQLVDSRRQSRIAAGSGISPQGVRETLESFARARRFTYYGP